MLLAIEDSLPIHRACLVNLSPKKKTWQVFLEKGLTRARMSQVLLRSQNAFQLCVTQSRGVVGIMNEPPMFVLLELKISFLHLRHHFHHVIDSQTKH